MLKEGITIQPTDLIHDSGPDSRKRTTTIEEIERDIVGKMSPEEKEAIVRLDRLRTFFVENPDHVSDTSQLHSNEDSSLNIIEGQYTIARTDPGGRVRSFHEATYVEVSRYMEEHSLSITALTDNTLHKIKSEPVDSSTEAELALQLNWVKAVCMEPDMEPIAEMIASNYLVVASEFHS